MAAAAATKTGQLFLLPLLPPSLPLLACHPHPRSVTGLAALLLTLGAFLFEDASLVAAGRRGLMGWTADLHYLPYVAYLGIVPGIVGHTGGRQES